MDQQKPVDAGSYHNARKILVIGSGGAGKSTFARRLGTTLDLEVIHLDLLYWRPNWVEPSEQEWMQMVEGILARDSWIMDGNYASTLEVRVEACDTVIFLDIPRLVCLWRVIKRVIQYRNKRRPDMAEGCPEKIDLKFMSWVWNYPKRNRPKIVKLLDQNSYDKKVVWLRSNLEAEAFLKQSLKKG
jgi:adenylate kinase family enzyme